MRMHRTVRLALATTAVVITALSLVAVPARGPRSARAPKDLYLAADTRMAKPATIGGAGSTFAAPLQNAAQVFYQTRNDNASFNGYQQ